MNTTTKTQREIFNVSQLNRQAKRLLEGHFNQVWIEGEISNLARPSSGHWYFSLKDTRAQVRCAMFRNSNQRLRFQPEDGQKIIVRAKLSLFEARGDYQLIVDSMEPLGTGDLARAFEELKNHLANEGLFAPELKQALPHLPKHIAIVTSPTGAAIHDILTVLKRRFPAIPVSIFPSAVQGEGAARQIAYQIQRINQCASSGEYNFDVIIAGRGGGSQEDLWAFNEEIVARAISQSHLPVVSAVGHEVDFSIADFVADVRAPTPSAAAELLSPDTNEWQQNIAGIEQYLAQQIQNKLQQSNQQLNGLQARLQHPGSRLNEQRQRLDELEIRLQQGWNLQQQRQRHRAALMLTRLQALIPEQHVELAQQTFDTLLKRFNKQLCLSLSHHRQHLDHLVHRLNTISPLATLGRGYAMVSAQGNVINSSDQLKRKQKVLVKLAKGEVDCTVDDIRSE